MRALPLCRYAILTQHAADSRGQTVVARFGSNYVGLSGVRPASFGTYRGTRREHSRVQPEGSYAARSGECSFAELVLTGVIAAGRLPGQPGRGARRWVASHRRAPAR
jgi:hypothetical protein